MFFAACSPRENSPNGRTQVAISTNEENEVAIIVRPRKAAFGRSEPVYFDVFVANPTTNNIVVPFIYDCVIDIDGAHYTQFPKPTLIGDDGEIIRGATFQATSSEAPHGTLTLNGPFSTVDAATGRLPLNLTTGRHTLILICGSYRSDAVTFEVTD